MLDALEVPKHGLQGWYDGLETASASLRDANLALEGASVGLDTSRADFEAPNLDPGVLDLA